MERNLKKVGFDLKKVKFVYRDEKGNERTTNGAVWLSSLPNHLTDGARNGLIDLGRRRICRGFALLDVRNARKASKIERRKIQIYGIYQYENGLYGKQPAMEKSNLLSKAVVFSLLKIFETALKCGLFSIKAFSFASSNKPFALLLDICE